MTLRVLVLGGNRYIGMRLLYELAERGHDVTVLNSHLADMPPGTRRLHGDRQQPGVLVDVLHDHRDEFDVVFDNTAYRPSDLEPLVELFRGRIQQFVFTSSVAVYRRSFVHPVREESRRHDPTDDDRRKAYGVDKVRCEDYLRRLFEDEGFPATSMRVTHTIGPRTPLASREPIFFERLRQGRPIFVPAEGFPFVHLVHIDDVARCIAAVAGTDRAIGNAYNVSGDEVTSVLGCIRLMANAAGVEPNIVHVPLDIARRANPPLVHWGEALVGGAIFANDKAKTDLPWRPELGLEAAYRDSYEWWNSEGRDLYEYDFGSDDELVKWHQRLGDA
jgi:nucleoside-diphosphate-sugar epimerase